MVGKTQTLTTMLVPTNRRAFAWLRPTLLTTAALLFAGGLGVQAQTITNPSFEADTFGNFPGYISGNGPITGWTAGNNSRAGLNPGGGTPFADNGVIPAGANVAFIQKIGRAHV